MKPVSKTLAVVTSVNETVAYQRYLPWWVKFWRRISADCDIDVQLFLAFYGQRCRLPRIPKGVEAFNYDPIRNFPSSTAAQLIRLHAAAHQAPEDTVCVTTDIDLLPLSSGYFSTLTTLAQEGFVVSRDVLDRGQYPICYLAGKPNVWREILDAPPSWQEWLSGVRREFKSEGDKASSVDWFIDQRLMFSKVNHWLALGGNLTACSDETLNFSRLDRSRGSVRLALGLMTRRISPEDFTDYHAHRPAWRYTWLYRLLSSRLIERR